MKRILYSNLKVFHYKDNLDDLNKSKKINAPITIRLKPTNLCNHHCLYCSYQNDELQPRPNMKLESIPKNKIIELAKDLVNMKVKGLIFTGGGEPLSYAYIFDIINIIKGKVDFAVLTNGSYLKGELAKTFAEYGTFVRISMDGWNDDSYSEYRKVPLGEYSKIIKNIKKFKSYGGKCLLSIVIITDYYNAPYLYDMISDLKSAGADNIKISPVIKTSDMEANKAYHSQIVNIVHERIAKAKKAFPDFQIHNSYHKLGFKSKKDYTWCPYTQLFPIIGADMGIYSCHDKAYTKEGLIASFKDKSFKEVWFESKKKFFKVNPSQDCNHHCEPNIKNLLILEYLDINKDHLGFL